MRDKMFIIWQPPKGENDDYDNENFFRLTPQSQKERERKEEEERLETYTKTHSDRRCQLRKDMVQNIVRLDEGEEEESEVTQEA